MNVVNCPISIAECVHPRLSFNYYQEDIAGANDSRHKTFVQWTRQLGICQECLAGVDEE